MVQWEDPAGGQRGQHETPFQGGNYYKGILEKILHYTVFSDESVPKLQLIFVSMVFNRIIVHFFNIRPQDQLTLISLMPQLKSESIPQYQCYRKGLTQLMHLNFYIVVLPLLLPLSTDPVFKEFWKSHSCQVFSRWPGSGTLVAIVWLCSSHHNPAWCWGVVGKV